MNNEIGARFFKYFTVPYQKLFSTAVCTEIMDVDTLKKKLIGKLDFVLLDVREEDELHHGTIPGSVNIPASKLALEWQQALDKNRGYIIYCRSGTRSRLIVNFLNRQGFHTEDLEGGILAWGKFDKSIEPY